MRFKYASQSSFGGIKNTHKQKCKIYVTKKQKQLRPVYFIWSSASALTGRILLSQGRGLLFRGRICLKERKSLSATLKTGLTVHTCFLVTADPISESLHCPGEAANRKPQKLFLLCKNVRKNMQIYPHSSTY